MRSESISTANGTANPSGSTAEEFIYFPPSLPVFPSLFSCRFDATPQCTLQSLSTSSSTFFFSLQRSPKTRSSWTLFLNQRLLSAPQNRRAIVFCLIIKAPFKKSPKFDWLYPPRTLLQEKALGTNLNSLIYGKTTQPFLRLKLLAFNMYICIKISNDTISTPVIINHEYY